MGDGTADRPTSRIVSSVAARHPIVLLLITSVCWSTAGLLIRLTNWDSVATAGGRAVVTIVALLLLGVRSRPRFTRPFIWGSLGLAGANVCYIAAIKFTFVANAVVLQFTASIWASLIAWFFLKEKNTGLNWFVIASVFIGIALFQADRLGPLYAWGNLLAILSGLGFAILTVALRVDSREDAAGMFLYGNLILAVLSLPWLLRVTPDQQTVSALLTLGFFQQAIPGILYTAAIKYVRAVEGVLITGAAAVLNPLLVHIFLGEFPATYSLVGCIIVFAVVMIQSVMSAKQGRIPKVVPD